MSILFIMIYKIRLEDSFYFTLPVIMTQSLSEELMNKVKEQIDGLVSDQNY